MAQFAPSAGEPLLPQPSHAVAEAPLRTQAMLVCGAAPTGSPAGGTAVLKTMDAVSATAWPTLHTPEMKAA